MKKDRSGRQVFLFTLGLALFVLIAAAGIVMVDWQGRSLSFGDSAPPFQVEDKPGGGKELDIKLLGREEQVDITGLDNFFNFLCDFSCIPHK